MTTVTVKFFARLREQVSADAISVELGTIQRLSELKSHLQQEHPEWTVLAENNLMAAVNHSMVSADCDIKAGDEIALFPPVTGG